MPLGAFANTGVVLGASTFWELSSLLVLGEHSPSAAVAKLAILLASGVAGALGYGLLRTLPTQKEWVEWQQ